MIGFNTKTRKKGFEKWILQPSPYGLRYTFAIVEITKYRSPIMSSLTVSLIGNSGNIQPL